MSTSATSDLRHAIKAVCAPPLSLLFTGLKLKAVQCNSASTAGILAVVILSFYKAMTVSLNFICFEIEKIKLALVEAFWIHCSFAWGIKFRIHFSGVFSDHHLIDSVANF